MKKRSATATATNVADDAKESNEVVVDTEQPEAKAKLGASKNNDSKVGDQVDVALANDIKAIDEPVKPAVTENASLVSQEYTPTSLDLLEVGLEESLLLSAMIQDSQNMDESIGNSSDLDSLISSDMDCFIELTKQDQYLPNVPEIVHIDFDDYEQMGEIPEEALSLSGVPMFHPQINEHCFIDIKPLFKNLKGFKKPIAIEIIGDKYKSSVCLKIQTESTQLTVKHQQTQPPTDFYFYFPSVNLVLLQQSEHVNLDLNSGKLMLSTTYQS